MAYDAFISYCHGSDTSLAEGLQEGLQRFARPWYRRSALRVFRDATGLSANPGLWSSISSVMEESSYLVVLCSPEAAASPWVGREIEHWRATKPAGHIIPVLSSGDLVWDNATGRFDTARTTALPPALAHAFTEEPLFVDMRWAHLEQHFSLREPRFQNQVADIAAPIHGVPKDALIGEDLRQHRRALRLAGGGALLVALLAIVIAVVALRDLHTETQKVHLQVSLASATKELKRTTAAAHQELGRLNGEKAQVASAGKKLTTTRDHLKGVTDNLTSTKHTLTSTKNRLTNTKNNLTSTKNTLTSTKNDLANAQAEVTSAGIQVYVLDLDQIAANKQLQLAKQKLKTAEFATELADAQALSTRLAAASESPDVANGHLDLALLLADAATRVPPPPNATAAVRASLAQNAFSALLGANKDAQFVHGFLHFPDGSIGPAALGDVAVSPDGAYVAAAETSDSILAGESPNSTHVFVWHANDPSTARSVTLPRAFDCLSDLEWLAGGDLITVENLRAPGSDSCVPRVAYSFTSFGLSVKYGATRVRVWHVSANGVTPRDPSTAFDFGYAFDGYAPIGASPVTVSPNGRFAMVSYNTGEVLSSGAPLVGSVMLDDHGHEDASFAEPGTFWDQPTFGTGSHYATGYDELGGPVVWKLDAFDPNPADCPNSEFDGAFIQHRKGCFAQTHPADADVFAAPPLLTPDEHSFTLERQDELAVRRYSVTSGALTGESPTVAAPLFGYAAGNNSVAIADSGGQHVQFAHWGDAAWTDVNFTSPFGCEFVPSFAVDENLLLLHQLLPNGDNCDSTLVVRTNALAQGVVRELQGFPIFSDRADHIVTEQRELQVVAGVPPAFGFQLWDFPGGSSGELVATRTNESAVISPDGSELAAYKPHFPGSAEGNVEVWYLDKPNIAPETLGGSLGTRAIAFRDDSTLIGVGTMGSGVAWDLKPTGAPTTDLGSLQERACEIAGRNLSTDELEFYRLTGVYQAIRCANEPDQ